MSKIDENSDIHVRLPFEHKLQLQTLARKINQARKKANVTADSITVSDVVRAAVTVLVNKRLNLLEKDDIELKELTGQLRRIGTNLNQLAHAYNIGLLIQPVNTSDLVLDLQSALTESLSITREICLRSATFNDDFLNQIQIQIDSIKPAE